jgi:hypothetical protein
VSLSLSLSLCLSLSLSLSRVPEVVESDVVGVHPILGVLACWDRGPKQESAARSQFIERLSTSKGNLYGSNAGLVVGEQSLDQWWAKHDHLWSRL